MVDYDWWKVRFKLDVADLQKSRDEYQGPLKSDRSLTVKASKNPTISEFEQILSGKAGPEITTDRVEIVSYERAKL